jgi:hypothetical protein
MEIVVGFVIPGMVLFAILSASREIRVYNSYLRGNKEYLVSKKRKNRRILIAALLILEALFLFSGFFILRFPDPVRSLTFWILPLMLIILLVYLGIRDFRETSRDLDIIVREATDVILKKKTEI